MPKQTAPNADAVTPEWLHDEIMSRVEPELMLCNAILVEEVYRRNKETAEQKKLRMARYQKAYDQYEILLRAMREAQFQKFKARRKADREQAQFDEEIVETQKLESLNADIDASPGS